jgi:hypothetical protein
MVDDAVMAAPLLSSHHALPWSGQLFRTICLLCASRWPGVFLPLKSSEPTCRGALPLNSRSCVGVERSTHTANMAAAGGHVAVRVLPAALPDRAFA